jgi:hypothetical protein
MSSGDYLTPLGQLPEQDDAMLQPLGLTGGEAPIPGGCLPSEVYGVRQQANPWESKTEDLLSFTMIAFSVLHFWLLASS